MNPDQHLVLRPDFTLYQGDVLHVVYIIFVNDNLKLTAVSGRNGSRSGPPDERFVLHPEIDQIGDGGDLQIMFLGKYLKVRHPGHGAVVFHNLTDDPRRF